MKHTCHAKDCKENCQPTKLMCRNHWSQVPDDLKKAVYKHYTKGQCNNMGLIKVEWLRAARRAINAVAGIPTGKLPY